MVDAKQSAHVALTHFTTDPPPKHDEERARPPRGTKPRLV
jgi:hypothetical protein